jgi:hypothetical protein
VGVVLRRLGDPDSNRTRSSASLGSSRTSSNASSQCYQTRSYRPRHAGRAGERAGATPSAAGAHPCCPGRVGAACCGRGLRDKGQPRGARGWPPEKAGTGKSRDRSVASTHVRVAMRAAGLGRGDACVTNRCPPARVDMQCRLPLLVEGVALAGDQAWLSPEADGDWRVEFRCRCPRTTMAHDDDLGCPPRRGLPHPVPAGTTVRLPARVRITLLRETKRQLYVTGPRPALFVRGVSDKWAGQTSGYSRE